MEVLSFSVLAKTVSFIPIENLLVETDSPYLSPHPLRGKSNEPSYIVHTINKLSQIKNISKEDVIAYTTNIDNEVKDLVLNGKIENFNKLDKTEQVIAGRAIWNYINEVYGAKMIPNILYMTKASNNVETGFIFVLGTTLANFTSNFVKFYKQI